MLREVLAKLEASAQISSARSGLPNSCAAGRRSVLKTCDAAELERYKKATYGRGRIV